jgi:MmyB-like transcription regulator ligand binding domain
LAPLALDPTPAAAAIEAGEFCRVGLYGPHLEVLAVNRMGVLLSDDFEAMPLPERNMLHWMFLNPKAPSGVSGLVGDRRAVGGDTAVGGRP